ncbi:Transcriptional regulator [Caenispirillum salinarum AK4]|uniref:siroheme decarboxylase n=1 Tax=Caenispirillum salinarum AK4 TaxID=1238182 RepID=K9HG71_9PROT|nr:Lrp/AsnC family transcriptional regulator [Caenispirillum salinarum]EKV27611.1 Transcriptional regulator [Caenispirillum salinarum AK4]
MTAVDRFPPLPDADMALVAALRDGLPLSHRPYADLGARVGMSEAEVLSRLSALAEAGIIRRFGAIVRHHEAGYRANAMVVLDVPDERVAEVGRTLGGEKAVTLCYRRVRAPGRWPYNLYAMVHGRDRAVVTAEVREMLARLGLARLPHDILFSTHRYKQTGGRYGRARGEA